MTSTTRNKTLPSTASIADFLSNLSPLRRVEAERLIALMQTVTGKPPILWGSSIIGFGAQHYRYETGREGDIPQLSFSPRKAAITIYFSSFEHLANQLDRLGKHKTSVGCLYINKLSDIDLAVLKEMLEVSFQDQVTPLEGAISVEQYIQRVPAAARPQFDHLRQLVLSLLPNAQEVLSYGIVGYKTDAKRAKVFISGFKDHVAIYPVPADTSFQTELKPYIHSKGSIWFALDEPLPQELIRKVVTALIA